MGQWEVASPLHEAVCLGEQQHFTATLPQGKRLREAKVSGMLYVCMGWGRRWVAELLPPPISHTVFGKEHRLMSGRCGWVGSNSIEKGEWAVGRAVLSCSLHWPC